MITDKNNSAANKPPLGDGGVVHKIVLGFSGGLDTTYCVKYLSEDKGFEVHSVVVNTGGLDRKSTRLNSSHIQKSRMPSSA